MQAQLNQGNSAQKQIQRGQFQSSDLSNYAQFLKVPTTKNSDKHFFTKRHIRLDSHNSNQMGSNGGCGSGPGSNIKDANTDANTPSSFNSSTRKQNRIFFGKPIKRGDSALKSVAVSDAQRCEGIFPQIHAKNSSLINQGEGKVSRKNKVLNSNAKNTNQVDSLENIQQQQTAKNGKSQRSMLGSHKFSSQEHDVNINIIQRGSGNLIQVQAALTKYKQSSFNVHKLNRNKQCFKTLEKIIIEQIGYAQKWQTSSPQLDLSCSPLSDKNSSPIQESYLYIPADGVTPHKPQNFLSNHKIREEHRARMIDWLIQVFRVFKDSADQTFFLALSLMDRYFTVKNQKNEVLDKSELHEIGLVSILLSTKYEDVIPISLSQILRDAGHSKFKQSDILNREGEVLQTLGFKLQSRNIYEESSILLKTMLNNIKFGELSKHDEDLLNQKLLFVCKLASHSMHFVMHDIRIQVTAIVYTVLKYLKKFHQSKISFRNQAIVKSPQLHKSSQNLRFINQVITFFKVQYVNNLENEIEIRLLKQFYIKYRSEYQEIGLKNLDKSYPQFFTPSSLELLSQKIEI
eukprot:403363124